MLEELTLSKKNRGDFFSEEQTSKSSKNKADLELNVKTGKFTLNDKFSNIVEDQGWNVAKQGFLIHTTDVPLTMFCKGKGKKSFKSGAVVQVLKDLKLLPEDETNIQIVSFSLEKVKEEDKNDKKYVIYKINKFDSTTRVAEPAAPAIVTKKPKVAKQVDLETVVSQVEEQKQVQAFVQTFPTPVEVPNPSMEPVATTSSFLPTVGKQEIDEVFPETEVIQPSFQQPEAPAFVDPFAPKPIPGVVMPTIPNYNPVAVPVQSVPVTVPEIPAFVPVVEAPIPAPTVTEQVAIPPVKIPIPTVAPPTPPQMPNNTGLDGIDEIQWR